MQGMIAGFPICPNFSQLFPTLACGAKTALAKTPLTLTTFPPSYRSWRWPLGWRLQNTNNEETPMDIQPFKDLVEAIGATGDAIAKITDGRKRRCVSPSCCASLKALIWADAVFSLPELTRTAGVQGFVSVGNASASWRDRFNLKAKNDLSSASVRYREN
jgi:hypothetical protein